MLKFNFFDIKDCLCLTDSKSIGPIRFDHHRVMMMSFDKKVDAVL